MYYVSYKYTKGNNLMSLQLLVKKQTNLQNKTIDFCLVKESGEPGKEDLMQMDYLTDSSDSWFIGSHYSGHIYLNIIIGFTRFLGTRQHFNKSFVSYIIPIQKVRSLPDGFYFKQGQITKCEFKFWMGKWLKSQLYNDKMFMILINFLMFAQHIFLPQSWTADRWLLCLWAAKGMELDWLMVL